MATIRNEATHRVLLSIASNHYQKMNLARARSRLGEVLSDMDFTEELWTEPVGTGKQTLYLNQLVKGNTTLTLCQLTERLKLMETECGRTERKRQMGLVTIDLDVLLYDNQQLHQKDWQRPYVTTLLPQVGF